MTTQQANYMQGWNSAAHDLEWLTLERATIAYRWMSDRLRSAYSVGYRDALAVALGERS